jgi:hypothetical protein
LIEWTYQGNPGPFKLELYQTYNSKAFTTITPKHTGNLGKGSVSWIIPPNIASGRYYVAITSLASGRISADSQQFYIGKEPAPVLKAQTRNVLRFQPCNRQGTTGKRIPTKHNRHAEWQTDDVTAGITLQPSLTDKSQITKISFKAEHTHPIMMSPSVLREKE